MTAPEGTIEYEEYANAKGEVVLRFHPHYSIGHQPDTQAQASPFLRVGYSAEKKCVIDARGFVLTFEPEVLRALGAACLEVADNVQPKGKLS